MEKPHSFKTWGKKLFRDIKEVYWISKIELSADREESIKDCLKDHTGDFKYPNNVEDFNDLFEFYQQKKQIIMKII